VDDIDFYSFSVSGPTELSATLTPLGGVFSQAAQFQTPTPFNANARNNLALALFSNSGAAFLASSDSTLAGGLESITNLLLPAAGTYFARITGADDTVQLYQLSLTATEILLGDYNKNGVVDGADYVVWRNMQGQSVTQGTGADGDFDGQITTTDYDVWRSHFGESAGQPVGSGFAVPEVDSIWIAALGTIAAAAFDQRRRTRTS
jgi:hypothetical protein